MHNTELYDELDRSPTITPILVAHEGGGAFMADAVSRTSDTVGTLLVVPAAGITHAASGIGEAGLDGIPMLVISGGIHSRSGRRYQLHDIDQHTLLRPVSKASFRILRHEDVIPTFHAAYRIATSGEPGPVLVELPYDIGNFLGEVGEPPTWTAPPRHCATPPHQQLAAAATALLAAERPGLFVGWGALGARSTLIELAEWLAAPVCTTLQGLSVFPGNHPLHTGMGFGDYAVPAAANAFAGCDGLLAVGTRFAEIPTGSYSMPVPPTLIHLDINPRVFHANFPASHTLQGDAADLLPALLAEVKKQQPEKRDSDTLAQRIADDKRHYLESWLAHDSKGRVSPAHFCQALRQQLGDDAIVVADDGHHTFLLAELLPIHTAAGFISPSDFNAMGYCVPAAIGARLANPDRPVVGIVGDGALRMTGLEMITASSLSAGIAIFVFNDGELAQISQMQKVPYNRKTCSRLKPLDIEALATATGCAFLAINGNQDCDAGIARALQLAAAGQPVLVGVAIDYSRHTRFTRGVIKTTFSRFTTRDKARAMGRGLWRHTLGRASG